MKKRVTLFGIVLLVLLSLTLVSAEENETEINIDEKAYDCLVERVEGECSGLGFEEQIFSLMALADDSGIQRECREEILDEISDGSIDGNILKTSQALLALNYIGRDTDEIEEWILDQKIIPTDLRWYLEIDLTGESTCDISYNDEEESVTFDEDKSIKSSFGKDSCFSTGFDGHLIRIKDDCLEKKFEITCDKDFISTVLFNFQNIWHVPSEVKSASEGGTTEHQIETYCFAENDECDYESNLWATFALSRAEEDVSPFTTYLGILDGENEEYFPSSFLYYLTNANRHRDKIVNSQRNEGFWDEYEDKNEYYSTALGLLFALSDNKENAKDWLEDVQMDTGCWNNNNIRDTSFLLWAGWPRDPKYDEPKPTPDDCEDYGNYCVSTSGECLDAGGEVKREYRCDGLDVCCTVEPEEQTCEEMGGEVCGTGYVCETGTVSAADTAECCLSSECVPEVTDTECEQMGYDCRLECHGDEEEVDYDCELGDVCCRQVEDSPSYWWIWLLIILIILVIVGIIFRDKLRNFLSKAKGKFKNKFGKGGGVTKTRPGFPPGGQSTKKPGPLRRMVPPQSRMPQQPQQPQKGKKSDELEDTLKKLREMGK